MGKSNKQRFWKNREKAILKLDNEKKEKQIINLKEELHTIKKQGEHSTIEKKFDKFGDKFSIIETSNKVDGDKLTKENNISLSRDPNASL